MIDPKYFRDNFEEVKANCEKRNIEVDLEKTLKLYEERNELIHKTQEIQRRRNEIARQMKQSGLTKDERQPLIEEARGLKGDEADMKEKLEAVEGEFDNLIGQIPNLTHPEVPEGDDEEDNREIRRWGEPPEFDFEAKDHVELGEERGLIDFESAAEVTGSKFYYLKNGAVLLEFALIRYALEVLMEENFEIYTTPDLARTEILEGIGFNPRGEETQVYSIANKSDEGAELCLIGTAEITLGGLYSDHIFALEDLPLLLGGVSHCFRTEAGSGGQASRGLYRVHQFTKVEMFAFTTPEKSEEMHDQFLAIEERIYQDLGLPYRVVDVCTGDLGGPAYRKYDIEAWMAGRGEYGEVTSTSNCTDYQARRLMIRFKRDREASTEYVHMLNGTAVAISRTLLAIMENYQREDGTIEVPQVLRPYVGKDVI